MASCQGEEKNMFLFTFSVCLWARDIGKDFWSPRYTLSRVMEYKVFIDRSSQTQEGAQMWFAPLYDFQYLCLPILLRNSWRQFSVASLSGMANRLAEHDCWIWHTALLVLVVWWGQCRSHCCLVDSPGESQFVELQFPLQTPPAPECGNPQPEQRSS